jgi:hypothetical protein
MSVPTGIYLYSNMYPCPASSCFLKRMTDFTNARQTTTQNDSQCEGIKMLIKSHECGKTGNSRSITSIKYTPTTYTTINNIVV